MLDHDDYDSEVDVFSCTDSEYEKKFPSDSDLKHEGGMLHLSDVVLRPKNNHAQNTIVSGPTAGCLARGPTPGPEPTPAADSPTQPAPVLSRRRTPLPGSFITKILFIMLLCGGVMTTVDGHLPVNVNRHVMPGGEHAPFTAPTFAWSPVTNPWPPNQCQPWRPPPPNRPPPFTHLQEAQQKTRVSWYTIECKATEMCLVCHAKRWEKHLVYQWKVNANVRIPPYKRGMFQSGNICFVFVFCIEYSARHRHMQSLIYLYAFPVFSCCKHVYFCQMQP